VFQRDQKSDSSIFSELIIYLSRLRITISLPLPSSFFLTFNQLVLPPSLLLSLSFPPPPLLPRMSPITSNGKKESGYARVLGSGASGESSSENEGGGRGSSRKDVERGGCLELLLLFRAMGRMKNPYEDALELPLTSQVDLGSQDRGANEPSSFLLPPPPGIAELMVFHPVDVSLNSTLTLQPPPQY